MPSVDGVLALLILFPSKISPSEIPSHHAFPSTIPSKGTQQGLERFGKPWKEKGPHCAALHGESVKKSHQLGWVWTALERLTGGEGVCLNPL